MWQDEEETEEEYEDAGMARRMLEDYFGTAMQQFPAAVIDLADLESMDDGEAIRKAREIGLI